MTTIPIPSIPTPDDVSIPCPPGPHLKGWHWRSSRPRGILLISHGLGEHSGLYRSLAEYLVSTLEIDVLGIDLRGHGRSPGRRGHLVHYDQLVENLEAGIQWAERSHPNLPRFLLGHSNGGVVATLTALRNQGTISALALTNPAFRLKYRPPSHKVAMGHVLRLIAPWVTLGGPLPTDALSRDPLQCVLLRSDSLMHTRICAPLFFGMRHAGNLALEKASDLKLPLLLVIGPDDPIIDPDSGRDFFDRFGSPDKTLLAPPGFRHDPVFERDRGLIYQGLASWLLPRCAPASPNTQGPSSEARDGYAPSKALRSSPS